MGTSDLHSDSLCSWLHRPFGVKGHPQPLLPGRGVEGSPGRGGLKTDGAPRGDHRGRVDLSGGDACNLYHVQNRTPPFWRVWLGRDPSPPAVSRRPFLGRRLSLASSWPAPFEWLSSIRRSPSGERRGL